MPADASLTTKQDAATAATDAELAAEASSRAADVIAHTVALPHRAPWAGIYGPVRATAPAVCSLRFDDVPAADYTTLFPLLKARDLVALFAVANNYVNPPGVGCTYAQLQEMQSRGMEMAHHSRSHTDPTVNGGYSNFYDEVITAAAENRAQNLFCDSFVQPGTWTADYYFDSASKLRGQAARTLMENFAVTEAYDTVTDGTISGLSGVKPFPAVNRLATTQVTLDTTTLAAAKTQVDQAISYGGHIHFLAHMGQIGGAGNLSLADLTALLDYIQAKRDAGWIDVLTPTAAHFAQRGEAFNLLGDPSFDLTAIGNYPSTAGLPWTLSVGTPTIVQGIRGRHGIQTQQSTNTVYQRIVAANTRSLRFEGYARGVSSGNTISRLNVKLVAADGSTTIQQTNIDTTVTDTAWTKVTASFGNDPRAFFWQFQPNVAEATRNIIWSDMRLYKV